MKTIKASEFKVARLDSETRRRRTLFGALKGSVSIKGDIIAPVRTRWDALR